MDQRQSDAMLIAQLRQKHQMKQDCLRAQEEESPLHSEAEKLLALSKLAKEADQPLAWPALLKKEQRFLESLLAEMTPAYEAMPAALQCSAAGRFAKNSLLLTRGALHRLQAAEQAQSTALHGLLEEAAFLLEGADGRA